ncbi:MAG: arsenate reductase ArsC [Acidobacteria bacterium]|nr:arsenate reductase ArsC [Acidobacteriota bacterium]MBI3655991.1 arsenate reductase ArsC [Acidobacteriota bacterium]
MGNELKKVLFLCIGNSCRSQMAEGFLRAKQTDLAEVYSAGTHPAGFIISRTIMVMQEKGIDINSQYSKGVDAVDLDAMDVVVTMGCCKAQEICSVSYSGEMIDWDIADPVGQPLEFYRMVRDEIETHVEKLLKRLQASTQAP